MLLHAPHIAVGEDFMEPENVSITLYFGLHGHFYLWLRVLIVEDLLYEGNENFFLMPSSIDMAVVFNLSMVEVTIVDDDSGKWIACLRAVGILTASILCKEDCHWKFVKGAGCHSCDNTCYIQLSLDSSRRNTQSVREMDSLLCVWS